jgi:hypothetical protein
MLRMLMLSFLVASSASAGVVMTFENRVGQDQGKAMVMSVEGLRLRMDLPADPNGSNSMIFLGDEDRLLALNHSDKTYFELDEETLSGLGDQLGGAMEQAMAALQEQLKNVPPEQREMVERMMKEQMPKMAQAGAAPISEAEIRRTSERGSAAGVTCTDYELWRDGNREQVFCVAEWSKVPEAHQAMEAMNALADFYSRVMASFQQKLGGQFAMPANPFGELEKLGGLPVRVRQYEDGALVSESVLQSIVSAPVERSLLSAPAGYSRSTMGM